MEPNPNQPGRAPEQQFTAPEMPRPSGPEVAPVPKTPEQPTETRESTTGAGRGDNPPPMLLPTIQQPAPAPSTNSQQPAQTTADDNPLTAGDDDLIEKEWVDRAKQIIEQTKDNPHAQEQEVNKLQADYLKKRYGRTVKLSDG